MTIIEKMYPFFSVFLALFAIIGYYPLLRAVTKQRFSRTLTWRVSLAVSDILIAINVMLYATKVYDVIGGDVSCQVVAFLSLGFGFANIANTAFVAYDKYCQVTPTRKGDSSNVLTLFAVWSLSFFTAALPLAGIGEFEKKQAGHVTCLLDLHSESSKFYIYLVAVLWFVVPVVAMIRSYIGVCEKTKECGALSILAPGTLLICYLPFTIHCLLSVFFRTTTPLVWVQPINILPKLLSVINPYVYMNFDPDLKKISVDAKEKRK